MIVLVPGLKDQTVPQVGKRPYDTGPYANLVCLMSSVLNVPVLATFHPDNRVLIIAMLPRCS